jgi:glycosyltransferase involved in cell wall biosynthesis
MRPLTPMTPPMSADVLPLVPLKPLPSHPEVSVLISSYNYGRFLRRSIESALRQSYQPKEIIIADDGSEDDSCEIVESYVRHDARVKLLRGRHQGMAGSLNAAFRAASGEVLCLLDADDHFLPGKIEAVVSAFRSKPDAGFAIHRAQMVDQYDRQRGVYPLLRSLPQGNCLEETLRNSGVLMGLPPTSNLALRYQVANSIFPIPESFSGYAEQVIHRMAPLLTSICAIDGPLSVWRHHGSNDGNSTRVAPERLERELRYMQDLWLGQKSYLVALSPVLAESMPSLEKNLLYMRMCYMKYKLRGDPAARKCHAALCAMPESHEAVMGIFWRYSIYLPRPLFQKCVDLLQTQSIWKEWVARVLRWRQGR